MKWVRWTAKRPNDLCSHCQRKIKAGQIALTHTDTTRPHGFRETTWHLTCIQGVIDAAPPSTDEESFHALRDRIAATGVAFPDLEESIR